MSLFGKIKSIFSEAPAGVESNALTSEQQAFLDLVVETAQKHAKITGARQHEEEAFCVVLSMAQGDAELFLDNIYVELAEASREEKVASILQIADQLTGSSIEDVPFSELSSSLLPILRASTYGSSPSRENELIKRRWQPFVAEALGIDSDIATQIATQTQLQDWGKPVEELWETARDNLNSLAGDPVLQPTSEGSPILIAQGPETYESSLVLAAGWLQAAETGLGSKIVFAVPDRSTLLITRADNADAVDELIDYAEEFYSKSPRAISPVVYEIAAEGRIQPFMPTDHPAYQRLRHANVVLAVTEYDNQKEVLDERFEHENIDVFVANCSGIQNKDGKSLTYAVWGQDVEALLPRADALFLAVGESEDPDTIAVPWEKALPLLNENLVPEPNMDPPRWRTLAFPSEATLSKLEAMQVTPEEL